jgi:hypothetical protein
MQDGANDAARVTCFLASAKPNLTTLDTMPIDRAPTTFEVRSSIALSTACCAACARVQSFRSAERINVEDRPEARVIE